jgi:hypothetical protein
MTSIIAAIAPSATVMPIGIFDQSGTTDTFRIIEGFDYAMSMKARIIVLPFGSGSTQKSKFMEEAVAQAIKGGALVIAAAGNDSSQIGFPAALPGVFSVGAIDLEDKLAQFSNFGVIAQGRGTWYRHPHARFFGEDTEAQWYFSNLCRGSGYSGASLVYEACFERRGGRQILRETAVSLPDQRLRAGRLDAAATVAKAKTLPQEIFLLGL